MKNSIRLSSDTDSFVFKMSSYKKTTDHIPPTGNLLNLHSYCLMLGLFVSNLNGRVVNNSVYQVGEVSDLNLHWIREATDGQVPHAAGHNVAVQGAAILFFLEIRSQKNQRKKSVKKLSGEFMSVSTGDERWSALTWKRLLLLKNMKLILDRDDLSDSLRETLDSREDGRVTWAKR